MNETVMGVFDWQNWGFCRIGVLVVNHTKIVVGIGRDD